MMPPRLTIVPFRREIVWDISRSGKFNGLRAGEWHQFNWDSAPGAKRTISPLAGTDSESPLNRIWIPSVQGKGKMTEACKIEYFGNLGGCQTADPQVLLRELSQILVALT
jgi:hypothetical protein